MSDPIRKLTAADLRSAMPHRQRVRIMNGDIKGGEDIAALRRLSRLTQEQFATALGISVGTLRGWEQDRRTPEGSAIALLRAVARHPRILRENLESVGGAGARRAAR